MNNDNPIKRALVLSGGGAKGAFQYGALRYIYDNVTKGESLSRYFDIITGVSIGALNGAMIAQDKIEELGTIWNTVTSDDMYKGKIDVWSVLIAFLFKRLGIISNAPLNKKLHEIISLESLLKSSTDFRFGVVSLFDGAYYSLRAKDFSDKEEIIKAILASTTMPIIWKPADDFITKDGHKYIQCIDGGIRNTSPLSDVINDDPSEIVIINCNPEKFTSYDSRATSLLNIAKRALLDIFKNQIFKEDIRKFIRINDIISQLPDSVIVKKSNNTPYKKYDSIIIEPSYDLGNPLDMSRSTINAHIEMGYKEAENQFEKFKLNNLKSNNIVD